MKKLEEVTEITMPFIDFINKYLIEKGDEFDAIIGDVEMDCTLSACENWEITHYCKKRFNKLLTATCTILKDSKVVEVDYDNYKEGENFCNSLAGYVSIKEFNALFETND